MKMVWQGMTRYDKGLVKVWQGLTRYDKVVLGLARSVRVWQKSGKVCQCLARSVKV